MTINLSGWKAFSLAVFAVIGAFDVFVAVPFTIYAITQLPHLH